MTDGFTALVFGVGAGGWVYAQAMRSTKHQTTSLATAGVAGLAGFIVIFPS